LNLHPAPFEPFRLEGRDCFVKRDDLIHPLLSGNKYRKLFTIVHTPSSAIDTLISYGGIQSNAMLSIAALCRMKGWSFEYTAKSVPEHLRQEPEGNYQKAMALGMRLHEVHPLQYEAAVAAIRARHAAQQPGDGTVVIPQGGADTAAREGIDVLAAEIRKWKREKGIAGLTVATPSGTGTTAAYLAHALPECTVVTAPAVGDAAYLNEQIKRLMPLPENLEILSTKTPYRFGRPHEDLLRIYLRLREAGIEFDLLYAPVMWTALLENQDRIGGELLYVHSGGVGGNATMLARYARRR